MTAFTLCARPTEDRAGGGCVLLLELLEVSLEDWAEEDARSHSLKLPGSMEDDCWSLVTVMGGTRPPPVSQVLFLYGVTVLPPGPEVTALVRLVGPASAPNP